MTLTNHRLLITAATALILNACGGGDSTPTPAPTPDENTTAEVNTTIPDTKVKKCAEGFSNLRKDDKITAKVKNTKLRIVHSQDATKKACVAIGDAKIN